MTNSDQQSLRRRVLGLVLAFLACSSRLVHAQVTTTFTPTTLEPTTTTTLAQPILGYADTHAHMFANLGFGGTWFQGSPGSPADLPEGLFVSDALDESFSLKDCRPAHRFNHDDIFDPGYHIGEHSTAGNQGYPNYNGWPTWKSVYHQQMYHRWLKRAHEGGLRLMVMLAVNNELLCNLAYPAGHEFPCDDMIAVDKQIDAAKELETALAADAMAHGEQKWFRIVYTPADARDAYAHGQLAVVLGIEVDSLFGCKKHASGCTEDHVKEQLKVYYDKGIRHVFPIHVFDNAFGGAAVYNSSFNIGTHDVMGDWFEIALPGPDFNCGAEGYTYSLEKAYGDTLCSKVIPACNGLIGLFVTCLPGPFFNPPLCAAAISAQIFCGAKFRPACNGYPAYPDLPSCNARGLTPLGANVMREMMNQHMIIDIDHMSALTTDEVLSIAEARNYPLVSGHTGFVDLSVGQKAAEGQKTSEVMDRLYALGGLVAPILDQGKAIEEILPFDDPNLPYPPCSQSGWSWAQGYKYAVSKMNGGAVALGSDLNGLVHQLAPRYGQSEYDAGYTGETCGGGVALLQPDESRLKYTDNKFTVPILGNELPQMNICENSGTECSRGINDNGLLDYNVDGLANVGLLPDFIADLTANGHGFTEDDLRPLFNSAEAYVKLWERVDAFTGQHCGNGVVEFDEACDDGNTEGPHCCSADCSEVIACGATTTTLPPPTCSSEPTFESVRCRLGALQADVDAVRGSAKKSDRKIFQRLLAMLRAVTKLIDKAENADRSTSRAKRKYANRIHRAETIMSKFTQKVRRPQVDSAKGQAWISAGKQLALDLNRLRFQ